jgi:glycosyltransferase involved in cell wall biosynthesis
MRVGVIQPQLEGRGGLQKYTVLLVEALAQRLAVEVISEHDVIPADVERAFNVRLEPGSLVRDPRCFPRLPAGGGAAAARARRNARQGRYDLTRPYDLLFETVMQLPWHAAARRNVLICHFPMVHSHRVRPEVPVDGLRGLLTGAGREQRDIRERLACWQRVVVSSRFAQRWVKTYWDRESEIIHPPIELPEAPDTGGKERWIIGAGYFQRPEPGLEWGFKRQELLIDTFRAACDAGLTGWELHLAGHLLLEPDEAARYLAELRDRAAGYPVVLHPDCPHAELLSLYRRGSVFWHAVGYGVDENAFPEKMEHFGMVTAEAMGWGCVPVVINRGGQPEIVTPEAGCLWDTPAQCVEQTLALAGQPDRLARLAEGAVRRAEDFGLPRFRRQVHALLAEELATLSGATAA